MAKGKPSRAFLEALKQDKKRRGDEKPGGGFQTPQWFFNNTNPSGDASENRPPKLVIPTTMGTARGGYRFAPWHAGVAAVLLLGVVVVIVLVSRGKSAAPAGPIASVETKPAPVQSSALDVSSNSRAVVPLAENPPLIPARSADAAGAANGHADAERGARIVNMNYVIFQSYENDAKANEAAAALRKAGIGCTVEKNHPYAPRWVLVMGTTPFAKTNTPDYQAYIRKAMQVSEKYAGASKWKKFEPNAYKWR